MNSCKNQKFNMNIFFISLCIVYTVGSIAITRRIVKDKDEALKEAVIYAWLLSMIFTLSLVAIFIIVIKMLGKM